MRKEVVITLIFCISATIELFAQIDSSLYYDKGVVINGVKWATRNVGEPGRFVETYNQTGEYYQWNCRRSWRIENKNYTACDSYREDTVWAPQNDPSPRGWRIPSLQEIQSLLDTTKVLHYDHPSYKIKIFVDKSTGDSLMLPNHGYCHSEPNFYLSLGDQVVEFYAGDLIADIAVYWSNSIYYANRTKSNVFTVARGGHPFWSHRNNRGGYFIRPVAE